MNDTASEQSVEETCVEVRLELHSPPQTYRAPLPYVPVVMKARAYQKADLVDTPMEVSRLSLDCGHRSGRRAEHEEGSSWRRSPSGGTAFEARPSQASDRGEAEDSGRRPEAFNCRPAEVPQGGGRIELFIREKGDPPPGASNQISAQRARPLSMGNAGILAGRRKLLERGRGVELMDEGASSGSCPAVETKDTRISCNRMLPMERDFSWNKPVNSVHKMVSSFENPGNMKRRSCASTLNDSTTGSRRLSKSSRVPVSTLAGRFLAASEGSRE